MLRPEGESVSSLTCWKIESNHKREKKTKSRNQKKKVTKSVWGMPWLSKATKDVISCEKSRGGANNL